jgi:hypothetical protein
MSSWDDMARGDIHTGIFLFGQEDARPQDLPQ